MILTKSIIAVDPGIASGLFFWSRQYGFSKDEVSSGGLEALIKYTNDFLGWGQCIVICEDFHIARSKGKKIPSDPMDILGYLRGCAIVRGWEFYVQSPDVRITTTDDDLKKVGLWLPAKAGHSREASRHGIHFMMEHREYASVVEEAGL